MTLDEIKNFRQLGSKTAGHPEFGHATGIETTTGPLGQGIANAVGFAIAERHLNAGFGDDLVNHKTYVLAGDGCLMEGISQEAITLAGHLKLKQPHRAVGRQRHLDRRQGLACRTRPTSWRASRPRTGTVSRCDGHKPDEIAAALAAAQNSDKPVFIACRTVIGFGAPTKAGTSASHGSPLGPEEIAGAREALGWPHEPFVVPKDLLAAWREAGARGAAARATWKQAPGCLAAEGGVPAPHLGQAAGEVRRRHRRPTSRIWPRTPPALATRNASQNALDVINAAVPETVGGSADLTGSNNTKSKDLKALNAADYGGRYIYYGIREHGMAAAMNGMALHGGVIPYGGTFLVFTDYCRPSIRLSALMEQRVIYVMTHDSIGLGEDGPTHQPVEHLAALRVIPNLAVYRPCDAVETAECWQLALQDATRPSVLALTRQKLKPARLTLFAPRTSARAGAYEVAGSEKPAEVVIFATGSEVEIAIAAKALLDKAGRPTRVVSVPSMENFEAQDAAYKAGVLGKRKDPHRHRGRRPHRLGPLHRR